MNVKELIAALQRCSNQELIVCMVSQEHILEVDRVGVFEGAHYLRTEDCCNTNLLTGEYVCIGWPQDADFCYETSRPTVDLTPNFNS